MLTGPWILLFTKTHYASLNLAGFVTSSASSQLALEQSTDEAGCVDRLID